MTATIPLELTGKPTFLVPRHAWQSERTYHVCPCSEPLIGLSRSDFPLCPRCGRADPPDIFAAMDRLLRTIPHFLEAMRVQDGPYGRYREHRNDPRRYRLNSSNFAMSLGHQLAWCGYDPLWSRRQMREWIDTILLDLNPESGLIEDPFDIAENGRSDEVIFAQYALSRAMVHCFRRSGFPERYQLPEREMLARDMFRDRQTAIDFLEDRAHPSEHLKQCTWQKRPWSKGSQVVRALNLHRQRLAGEDDGIEQIVHQWLDVHQNPQTGYWGGEKSGLNHAACGAFKILVAYTERDWPIPRPDRIIDTTLSLADETGGFGSDDAGHPSFGCTQFDPLMLLRHAMRAAPAYRRQEIYDVTARSYLNVRRCWSHEEHFFKPVEVPDASMEFMMGLGTVIFMAEILLGIEIFRPDR